MSPANIGNREEQSNQKREGQGEKQILIGQRALKKGK
jgi:hypothetical protein